MKKFFGALGLWALLSSFVFGAGWAVVAPAGPAYATDTATYLGVVEIDCRDGKLLPQTVVFSGGAGDTFKLLSTSDDCTLSDASNVLTNEPANLAENVVSPAITVVSAGEFTITDDGSNAVTFRTFAGPVFGNHDRGMLPQQRIDFTCNGGFSGFESTVIIFYQAVGDEITLYNESSSEECVSFTGIGDRLEAPTGSSLPTSLGSSASTDESDVLQIKASGSFTSTTSTLDTITFHVLEGKQPDIGVEAQENDVVTYSDAFYSVSTGVVDAKVTVTDVSNLDSEGDHDTLPDLKMDQLDENVAPGFGNWALSPAIDVFGSSRNSINEGSATFRIDFFEHGTSTPVTLPNLAVTIVDIDVNQSVSAPNVSSFSLSSAPQTELVASRVGNMLTVSEPDGNGSSDSDQENWVVMNFDEASSLEFTVAAINGRFASFGLLFAPAPWSVTPVTTDPDTISLPYTSGGSEPSNAQGIHLDLLAGPGSRVEFAPVLMEGQGLLPGSTYSLRLGPGGQSLKSGQVSSGGRFSHQIPLSAGLAPGTYFVELSAIGRDGAILVLNQSFTVGVGGVITQVVDGMPGSGFQSALAATGPSDTALGLGGLSAVLMGLVGAALLLIARRQVSRKPR
jgi:hypothetical protein